MLVRAASTLSLDPAALTNHIAHSCSEAFDESLTAVYDSFLYYFSTLFVLRFVQKTVFRRSLCARAILFPSPGTPMLLLRNAARRWPRTSPAC